MSVILNKETMFLRIYVLFLSVWVILEKRRIIPF
jgi:hypothetical protein